MALKLHAVAGALITELMIQSGQPPKGYELKIKGVVNRVGKGIGSL